MKSKSFDITLDGTDMTSNIASDPIFLGQTIHYSIQLVFTGAPMGTFTLEVSNDLGAKEDDIPNPSVTNWTTLTGSDENITAAGSLMYTVENCSYRWVRVVWTDTVSGASTITVARANTKGA